MMSKDAEMSLTIKVDVASPSKWLMKIFMI